MKDSFSPLKLNLLKFNRNKSQQNRQAVVEKNIKVICDLIVLIVS